MMDNQNEKIILGEHGFWQKWFSKLLYTLISVKLWGLIAGTCVSTYLLLNPTDNGYSLSGAQWLTFNTTIWALIFGMKEIFRITERRDLTEQANLKEQMESKLRIRSIMTDPNYGDTSKTYFTKEGLEIVGNEPDSQN